MLPLALACLLAGPVSAVVGTRAPGPEGGFGNARFSPVSKSWSDAFGFFFSHNDLTLTGRENLSLSVFGVQARYDKDRLEVLEPLAWALSQKLEPMAFATLEPEARAKAVSEAMALASEELAAKAAAAMQTWTDEAVEPRALERTVLRAAAIRNLWYNYLPKDLRASFERSYLEAHEKVRLLREAKVLGALEKTAQKLGPAPRPETEPRDDGIAEPLARRLAENISRAEGPELKTLLRDLGWTAAQFPETQPIFARALLTMVKSGSHERRFWAAEGLRLAARSDIIPVSLHAEIVAALSGLEYPTLILRAEALRAIAAIGSNTPDLAARVAAYKALVRESVGPYMKQDQEFDQLVLVEKKRMDELMGPLPHAEVVEEYRRRWGLAAQGKANTQEDVERLRVLEKRYPALLHNLQIPLNPPVQEKKASDSDANTGKPPGLPKPNPN